MKRVLSRTVDNSVRTGTHSGLIGDCTGLRGNCSGLSGNCTGLSGNLDEAGITVADREAGIYVGDLIVAR